VCMLTNQAESASDSKLYINLLNHLTSDHFHLLSKTSSAAHDVSGRIHLGPGTVDSDTGVCAVSEHSLPSDWTLPAGLYSSW